MSTTSRPRARRALMVLAALVIPSTLWSASPVKAVSVGSGTVVTVSPNGAYTITVTASAWTFGGSVGQALTSIDTSSGSDSLGTYQQVSFAYQAPAARRSSIRVHDAAPVVTFTTTYLQAAANAQPFPDLTTFPALPYHLAYRDTSASPYSFLRLDNQGPWTFFDASARTFVFSPASDYLIASDSMGKDKGLAGGINPAIATLPQGFTHSTMLVTGSGINATMSAWGAALTSLDGSSRPANDSSVELNTLGYWTDNGAAYFHGHAPGHTLEQTLVAMRGEFADKGVPLGYLNVDSWWYMKDFSDGPPATPANLPAGLGDKLRITAQVKSSQGGAVAGDTVSFATAGSCGAVLPAALVTDAAGMVATQVGAAPAPGFCTVTATGRKGGKGSAVVVDTLSPRPQQSVALSSSTGSCPSGVAPPCVPAGGKSSLAVVATVSGPAAAADPVRVSVSGPACGTASTKAAATDSNGRVAVSYQASKFVGACTLTVTEANGAGTASLAIAQTASKKATNPPAPTTSSKNTVSVSAVDIGVYRFVADDRYLPDGLSGLGNHVGLPMVTHSRWLAFDSPYRNQYPMSRNMPISPQYYADVTAGTSAAGAVMYEQDWLSSSASPLPNLTDPEAFMSSLATGTARSGQSVLFSQPEPADLLDGSRFANITATRLSQDRFNRGAWDQFLHGSALSGALGIWPWSDTFLSSETGNLLLGTLSAGMVGVGDAQGAVSAATLLRSIRADGVIVKPDVPAVPTDDTLIRDAQSGLEQGGTTPMVAATHTDHQGMRAAYVVAYNRGGSTGFSFRPSELGVSGPAYVYDVLGGTGSLVGPGQAYTGSVADLNYYVVVPVGPSGIAFLGDTGNFVSLGGKRVTRLSDGGTLRATVAFAAGETVLSLTGHAPSAPHVVSSTWSAGAVTWDPSTGLLHLGVSPDGSGSETLELSL